MCGQFGIMTGGREVYADDFIKDAFTASMLRGIDSSGLAMIDPDTSRYLVHKLPVAGNFFAEDRIAGEMIRAAGAPRSLTMCHVRAATVGKVNMSNAHPFEIVTKERNVVGTHNGTLRGWQTKTGASTYTVDSEWALSRIARERTDAFEEITGAFAFAWWESDDPEVLNLARNDERPLAVAFIENGGMAYASEPGMLFWLLERNRIKMEGPIIVLDTDTLYRFEVGHPKDFTKSMLPKPPVAVSSYSSTTGTYNYGNNRHFSYTVMDNVTSLLAQIGGEALTPLTRDDGEEYTTNFPLAFESEIALAKSYGWHDVEVEFYPTEVTKSGNTVGIADVVDGNYSYEGFIRGDHSTWPMSHTWKCRILGVQDDAAGAMIFILDKPFKTIAPVEHEMEEA